MPKREIFVDQPSPRNDSSVLVSGASFAGLATAYWMNRLGYRVTVVEVANGLRKGGTPVDVQGAAIGALTDMGLIDAVRANALPPRAYEFKDVDDGTLEFLGNAPDSSDAPKEQYEIHRDALLEILLSSIEDSVEAVRFGQSIKALESGEDGVGVTFADGTRRNYDLVFGCDGNRSNTRRLAFGADDFSHFMGGYFFIKVVPATGLVAANVSQIFSVPGRTALLNGYDDRTDVALAFRAEHEIDYDYRDHGRQRRIVHEFFDGLGWKVPAMLEHIDADNDFYFDRLNQIKMPSWSRGRIALVGDAAYCVSPLAGMGGSLALIGAATLGHALMRYGPDYAAAFRDYQDDLQPFIDEVQQKAAGPGMAIMFPADAGEIAERDRRLAEGTVRL